MAELLATLRQWRYQTGLTVSIALFVVSRLAAYAAGVRFDATPLVYFSQIADTELLRTRLAETILYMHGQPPLFNLLIGIVLKIAPGAEATLFGILWFLVGLAITAALYTLLVRMEVRPWLAALWTALFVVGPTPMLYENWLYVTYPIALLLLLSALALHRFVEGRRMFDAVAFFSLLALAGLTRSVYQLAWIVLIAALLALLLKRDRWRVVLAAAIPILLVAALYTKNAIIVGTFGANTTLGMNMVRATTRLLPQAEREELVRNGTLSQFALLDNPFSSVDTISQFIPLPAPTGIPLLDQQRRSSGAPNFNHLVYVRVDSFYRHDAFYVALHRPLSWLKGMGRSALIYTLPGTDFYFARGNREHIKTYDRIYNLLVYGQFDHRGSTPIPASAVGRLLRHLSNMAFILMAGIVAGIVYGVVRSIRLLRSRSERILPGSIAFVYMTLTVCYVSLVSNAFEEGENNRYRFEVDPLLAVLLALLLVAAVRWWRGRGSRSVDNSLRVWSGITRIRNS